MSHDKHEKKRKRHDEKDREERHKKRKAAPDVSNSSQSSDKIKVRILPDDNDGIGPVIGKQTIFQVLKPIPQLGFISRNIFQEELGISPVSC